MDVLRKQLPDAVLDQVGIAPVVETGRRGVTYRRFPNLLRAGRHAGQSR
jgi:hypothetical protein